MSHARRPNVPASATGYVNQNQKPSTKARMLAEDNLRVPLRILKDRDDAVQADACEFIIRKLETPSVLADISLGWLRAFKPVEGNGHSLSSSQRRVAVAMTRAEINKEELKDGPKKYSIKYEPWNNPNHK
ncbi:MAG: hypothetical protein M1828_005515 [Chrysothrix sp. TS-e1954]|nr:MAG: hypothetical protein M1828_005515 [Chrysothrix sp. TS-e1954]